MVTLTRHPALFAIVVTVYVVALWNGIGVIVSIAGGWWGLAKRYRTEKPFPTHTRRMRSGRMRALVGYGNVLMLGSDAEGIYLGVLFLFRMGHPRLFVPWDDIEIGSPKRWLIFKMQKLRLGPERIPLRLRMRLVDFLQAGRGAGLDNT